MWHDRDSTALVNDDPIYNDFLTTEKSAWKKIVDFLPSQGINTLLIDLGEGVQYESHPEIACKGAWSKQELAAELRRIRSMGITPIPKLNFSTLHDAWMGEYSRMVSTPEYYQVVKDLIDEMIELFQSPMFHLGLDEESWREIHMQRDFGFTVFRGSNLFWHDIQYIVNCCEQKGVRAWAWASRRFHQDTFDQNMPKSVMLSEWVYDRLLNPELLPDYIHDSIDSFALLDKAGYDQIPTCSTCENQLNADDLLAYCKKVIAPERLKGFLTAPWCKTTEHEIYTHYNESKRFATAGNKYFK